MVSTTRRLWHFLIIVLKPTLHSIARERMIGWYHSGPKLRASDLEINEVFKRFMPRPVMVIVDVRPQTVGMPTDTYFAVEEIKDVCSLLYFSDPQFLD